MALISINELSIGFRGPALLDHVGCQIETGQRIGLLGRNGSGKTTFMRMLRGELTPDHGRIVFSAGAQVGMLPQDAPQQLPGSIAEIVAEGVLKDDDPSMEWRGEHHVENLLMQMQLEGAAAYDTLSTGMKRRVLLARAIVSSPDLLLLDEPTNHLDIEAISWLENFLLRWKTTLIFVTHDRMFLQKLATRILEIDRGRLFDWSCDYATFLKRKEASLAAQEKQEALFDKKLAQEEVWIRQGIKARRTRNEGRVRALEQMRSQRSERRKEVGRVNLNIQQGDRSGVKVAELKKVSFSYGERDIVRDFSTTLFRGEKIGVVGPNGAGKTTLLRLLLGKLTPQSGTVRLGSKLQIAYFDQLRDQLDEGKTVQENVGDGYDTIQVNGQSKHIIGYLQDFLFTAERARTPVRFLSGGERNRVLLAKLFAKPANVVVLDEPTNDLDTETLELLEQRLVAYEGTVLLVSHDRTFLNNVVTSTIVFEEDGAKEYAGGYDDWLRQRAQRLRDANQKTPDQKNTAAGASRKKNNAGQNLSKNAPAAKASRRRLSFKEKSELGALPATIETLETEIKNLHQVMARANFYQQPGEKIAQEQDRLQTLEARLAKSYQRWEELEESGA